MTALERLDRKVERLLSVLKSLWPGFWRFPRWRTGKDTLRVFTTVGFPVLQFVASRKVPKWVAAVESSGHSAGRPEE